MPKIAVLYEAGQAVLSTFDLSEVLQRILAIARDYFHLPNVAILLIDKEAQQLCVRSQIGWDAGQRQDLPGISRGAHGRLRSQEAASLRTRRQQGRALCLCGAIHKI